MIYKKIYFCKKLITLLTYFPLFLATTIAYSQDTDLTPFEKNPARTTTYAQCIDFYQLLDRKNRKINMLEAGPSDVAEPLHLVIIDKDGYSSPEKIRAKGRAIILINNGIHPGEPEGIDASMMLARELPATKKVLDNVSIVIIPIYNVGGALMRNNHTRANQNGPESYGFRGNRNYLDLNRDYIKCDSRNAKTFTKIFNQWDPDVFIETHTSDGADYPYNISLLASQKNKLSEPVRKFMYLQMLPYLYDQMKAQNDEMIPYVNVEDTPKKGIYGFLDNSRFSTGFASLHHSFPLMIETHMLKPFNIRVQSTLNLMNHLINFTANHHSEIREARKIAILQTKNENTVTLKWKMDASQADTLLFKGYETELISYPNLQLNIYNFNPERKYEQNILYYNTFIKEIEVSKPKYYILPKAYDEVAERLKANRVELIPLTEDTIVDAIFYKIEDFTSPNVPYENHFYHNKISVSRMKISYPYFKGDYLISTNQTAVRFLIETLEPQGVDSYFSWNFFDAILQRKEYFSDYLFAPIADKILQNDPILKLKYQNKLNTDSEFATNKNSRLEYIYEQSHVAEPYYRIYPVARIE
ncbi:MAG: hypothetical protein KA251_07400 [Saprospiraceae bacterium]|nr:hypothetical protein [Saprospiraceae bacterium]